MKLQKLTGMLAVMGLLAVPGIASATYGYFSHGYGMKSEGMAGVSSTRTNDSFGGANNPAAMVFAGNRFDVGLDWFSPRRTATRSGSGAPGFDGSVDSDSKNFYIPQFGYNTMLSPDMSVGVSVYGNGGMNTTYPGGQFTCYFPTPTGGTVVAPNRNMLCGSGTLGVDLMQLIIAPTWAFKIAPGQAVGVAPLIGYQRFSAQGLDGFSQMSGEPNHLTNNGYDSAHGFGARVGYLGKFPGNISVGAAYATKVYMTRFHRYSGLFAQGGKFDMPSNFNAGIAWKPVPILKLGFDYQRINYSDIPAIANPSSNQAPLGADGGPGFGWKNVNVYKFGASVKAMPNLTLRAGYARSDNPVQASDVTFNILAPGVVRDHYTLGATYGLGNSEITAAYMHAVKNTVTGPSLFTAFGAPATTTESVSLVEDSFGLAWGMKF